MLDSVVMQSVPKRYHSAFESTLAAKGGMSLYMVDINDESVNELGRALVPSRDLKNQANACIYAMITPLNKIDAGISRFFVGGDYGRKTAPGIYENIVVIGYLDPKKYVEYFRPGKESTYAEYIYSNLKESFMDFCKNGANSGIPESAKVQLEGTCIVVSWCDVVCRMSFAPCLSQQGSDQATQAMALLSYKAMDSESTQCRSQNNSTYNDLLQYDLRTCVEELECKFVAALPDTYKNYIRVCRHCVSVCRVPISSRAVDLILCKILLCMHYGGMRSSIDGGSIDVLSVLKHFFVCLTSEGARSTFDAFDFSHFRRYMNTMNTTSISDDLTAFNSAFSIDWVQLPDTVVQDTKRRYTDKGQPFFSGIFDASENILGDIDAAKNTILIEIGEEMGSRLSKPGIKIHHLLEPLVVSKPSLLFRGSSATTTVTRSRSGVASAFTSIFIGVLWITGLIALFSVVSIYYTLDRSNGLLETEFYSEMGDILNEKGIAITRYIGDVLPPVVDSSIYYILEDAFDDFVIQVGNVPAMYADTVPRYIQVSILYWVIKVDSYLSNVWSCLVQNSYSIVG